MATVEVKVPDIGDFKDVAVIELLVKVGDAIKQEQSLVTVESDKASMEIPASTAGIVKEIKVAVGDKVNEGSLLLLVEAEGAAQAVAPAAAPATAASAPVAAPAAAPVTAAPAASSVVEVLVPDIGDFDAVSVIEVFVKPGDAVKLEQSLITVESDKASMEIPSSHAGTIKELKVKLGDKVSKGSVLALVEVRGAAAPAPTVAAAAAPAIATAPAPVPAATAVAVPAHNPGAPSGALPHASPSIRKQARELGVPLAEVKGSGPKGRIVESDLQNFVKSVMSGAVQTLAQKAAAPATSAGGAFPGLLPWPKVDFE